MRRTAIFLLKILETVLLVLISKLCFSSGWAIHGVVGISTFHFAAASLYELAPLVCAVVVFSTTFSLLTLWMNHSKTAAAGAVMAACGLIILMLCPSHIQFTALAKCQAKLTLASTAVCILIGLLGYQRNK